MDKDSVFIFQPPWFSIDQCICILCCIVNRLNFTPFLIHMFLQRLFHVKCQIGVKTVRWEMAAGGP